MKRNPDDIGHAFLGYQKSLAWLSGQEVGDYWVVVVKESLSIYYLLNYLLIIIITIINVFFSCKMKYFLSSPSVWILNEDTYSLSTPFGCSRSYKLTIYLHHAFYPILTFFVLYLSLSLIYLGFLLIQDLYDPADWQTKSYPKGHFYER